METKWTNEQQKAIDERNSNLLVSAAAGSGKTAVLVERIKKMVLNGECSLDRMLIVTFTNAAASEMREKIENALNKAIRETDDPDVILRLKKELDLVPRANISTFHAFALEVIRRYFYILKIEPNFKICDETQAILMKEASLKELLDNHYDSDDQEFYDFLNRHSGERNDDKVKKMILDTYQVIQSLPKPFDWLNSQVEFLNLSMEDFKESKQINEIFENSISMVDVAIKSLKENFDWGTAEGLRNSLDLISEDLVIANSLRDILETGNFNDVRGYIFGISFKSLLKKYYKVENPSSSLTDDYVKDRLESGRAPLKDAIKVMKESYFYDSIENLKEDLGKTYEDTKFLAKLVCEFNDIFSKKKEEKGLADFNDIEHWAYNILLDPDVAGYYREKFKYIYIDEYQDSNVIQDELIARVKRDNNLFMVGDIKQSIYKFRLAKPEIFKEKYERYATETNSKRIDLNKNFRSKKSVIDFINDVFVKLMPDYTDSQKLYTGDVNGEKLNFDPKLYLANIGWDYEDIENMDDEIKNLRKAEKEALATVKIIKDHLGKPFFDSKKGIERPLELRDIVILMRGVKGYGEEFYKILMSNGIPCYIDDNDGFFTTIEVNLIMALLSLIDNEKQDIALLTVMRSEVWKYSIDELIAIRLNRKYGSYHDALVEYSKSGEEPLRTKCKNTLEDIKRFREESRVLPLEDLVWKLVLETGIYLAMGALPSGLQRQANLRALADKAISYRTNGDGSLYGFIKYIEAIKDGKVKMGQVKMVSEGDNTVRMTTIHKSKGLEFPMVILAGYCKKLNYDSVGKNAVVHDEMGIALPLINYEESWYKNTILQNIIKERMHKEQVEEEKRVLYVALTRARDILAMVGVLDDTDEKLEKIENSCTKDTSYFTMTGKYLLRMPGVVKVIPNSELLSMSREKKRAREKVLEILEENKKADEKTNRIMSYTYGYTDECKVKSKYSVSELNSKEETIASLRSLNKKETKDFTKAEIGVITHKVLELLDFNKARSEGGYLELLLDDMVKREHLTQEEREVVDIKALREFVNSNLGRRIAESKSVEREKPFNMKIEIDGVSTLVQGIIDCFFEENDYLVLVDYKNSGITDENRLRETYIKQIDIYKEALEKASGESVKESYLYIVGQGKVISMNRN